MIFSKKVLCRGKTENINYILSYRFLAFRAINSTFQSIFGQKKESLLVCYPNLITYPIFFIEILATERSDRFLNAVKISAFTENSKSRKLNFSSAMTKIFSQCYAQPGPSPIGSTRASRRW